jgi:hypothetical protein
LDELVQLSAPVVQLVIAVQAVQTRLVVLVHAVLS